MKILVTGASGLVGSRFVELCSKKYELIVPEYPSFNLVDPLSILKMVEEVSPEVVIHFAAFTDLAKAEEQRGNRDGDCYRINVEGTKNLVATVNKVKTHFIHISTDMVFSGSADDPGPYSEDALPEVDENKLTWYGFTKREAERSVSDFFQKQTTILRLIYPVRAKYEAKLDYLRKPLMLYNQSRLYPLFFDQQVSISFIDEVALALEKIIDNQKTGIFHAGSRDTTNPHELISYFISKVKGKEVDIPKISLTEFLKTVDNPVRYPRYGGLKVEETERQLGIRFSTWRKIAGQVASQLVTGIT